MKHLGLCLIICSIFCIHSIVAQNYNYRQFTTDDGLPTNYVYGVIEDNEGFIWAYTENGIAKFDGYTFQNFNTQNGLPHNDVYYMVKDSFGTLWCSTSVNTPTFINQDSIYQIVTNENIQSLYNCIHGKIYHNSRNILYEYDKNRLINRFDVQDFNEMMRKGIIEHTIHVSDTHSIGIHLERGCFYANLLTDIPTYKFKISDPDFSTFINNPMYFSYIERFNLTIFYNNIGVLSFNVKTGIHAFHAFDKKLGQSTKHTSLNFSFDGQPILETDKGYFSINSDQTLSPLFIPENIANKYTILRLYIDRKGNYWIGTREGGLLFIAQSNLKTEILSPKLENDIAVEKLFKNKETIYGISDNSRIYQVTRKDLKKIYQPKVSTNYNTFYEDKDGDFILATGGKKFPFVWNPQTNTASSLWNFRKLDHLYAINLNNNDLIAKQDISNVKALAFDNNKSHFFYSWLYGTYVYHPTTKKVVTLLPNRIDLIEHDTLSDITYFGVQNEVFTYQNELFSKSQTFNDIVTSIFIKDSTHILVGTQNTGLYDWNSQKNTITKITNSPYIRTIHKDNDQYYLACNAGIVQLEETDNQYKEVNCFDKKDGLFSTEILDVLTDSTYIYAATLQGVARMEKNTSIEPHTEVSNPLFIKKIEINKQIQDFNKEIQLDHTENNISIHYHLLDYASATKETYQYRLSPIQSEWTTTTSRSVQFADLRPNEYLFELKANDLYGKEYCLATPISFEIEPAFWERTWFRILAFLLFLGILLFIIKKREQRQLQKLAHEKSLNDRIADLQMQSLRAQMNPHFIFNALGSIQYFIQTHRTDEADNFLTMFARLMRKYLDSATERVIDLRTEIDLLKEYTHLEMMRFEGQFSTKIIVPNHLNIDEIRIPSMMIQPFVENAIIHGLQPRLDHQGQLKITFDKKNEVVSCVISDNGIGRTNATSQKKATHKSRGMKNVFDRIKTLKANGLSDIQVVVTDWDATDKEFTGTNVFITFRNIADAEDEI